MQQIMFIVAAVLCTLAAFVFPSPAPSPWYYRVHLGWAGVAFWMWAIILGPHLR